jgi:hypothetical protein
MLGVFLECRTRQRKMARIPDRQIGALRAPSRRATRSLVRAPHLERQKRQQARQEWIPNAFSALSLNRASLMCTARTHEIPL